MRNLIDWIINLDWLYIQQCVKEIASWILVFAMFLALTLFILAVPLGIAG